MRTWSLTFPERTSSLITAGTVLCAAFAQIGHCRSTYSVTVSGAFGSPSTPWFSGIPASSDEVVAGGAGFVPPLLETATPAPARMTAAATAAPSRHRRLVRVSCA